MLTGLIAPHQAAGYSGGRKSLTPGVAALETIAKQHSFPIRPYDPAMGWMKGNPFHEVAVTVARTVGIDFIITPGGFPRDIDLHQAQKAMSTAEQVAADGGVIVLLAECADGIGKFAAWLKGAKSPQDVIERFKREGFTRRGSTPRKPSCARGRWLSIRSWCVARAYPRQIWRPCSSAPSRRPRPPWMLRCR
ncbi:MAG TPA: lactate racemase domain-containing protein [Candidatus Methylomirabilis sp.]